MDYFTEAICYIQVTILLYSNRTTRVLRYLMGTHLHALTLSGKISYRSGPMATRNLTMLTVSSQANLLVGTASYSCLG